MKYYPQHVAIIPDGNRTRAKEHNMESFFGHLEGFNRVIELAKYIAEFTSIKCFTAWGLSTENLKQRTKKELDYLFTLYKKITEGLYDVMRKYSISFRIAGDVNQLPDDLRMFLEERQKEFSYQHSDRYIVLAINYGGQDEILRAVQKLSFSGEPITKSSLEKNMDFGGLPSVELVIRTKQKYAKRLSGFMLWWIGYAQLYFTDLYCPDFTVEEFKKALAWYDETVVTQNFGK